MMSAGALSSVSSIDQYMCVSSNLVIVYQTHNRGTFRFILPHFTEIFIRYSTEIFVPVHISMKIKSDGNEFFL